MAVIIKLWIFKLWKGYKSIALEVSALLFMSSVLMTYLIMQDYVIGRICLVNFGYDEEVCQAVVKNNGNYTVEESNIQKVMAQIRRTRAILDYSIPIIFVLYQGSWSDIHGRKMSLLLPCFGFTLQAVALALSYFFQNWDGLTVVLVSSIPKCLSGADVTFRMAALSYVSDISTEHGRTLRTGLISAAFTLGVPMGFALGGAAVKVAIRPEIAFLISAGICTVAFLTILIFVDNKPHQEKMEGEKPSDSPTNKNDTTNPKTKRKCLPFDTVRSVVKSLTLSFDGVSSSKRIQIIFLVFAIICINAPIQGEFGVMYLYLRKKMSWDLGDYGIFSTYVSLIGVIGTILSMGVFCSLLKLSDPIIGFIAGLSQFAGCFMYAFAYSNLMIYLAPTIDMLNGTMAVIAKSMLSKLCPPEDFGKMFSFLAVIELLVPLLFDPTYSTIYEHTVDTFPGAVFLLSAALTVPPQLTYLYYIWRNKNAVTCEITETTAVACISDGKTDSSSISNQTAIIRENYMRSNFYPPSPVILKSALSSTTVNTVIP